MGSTGRSHASEAATAVVAGAVVVATGALAFDGGVPGAERAVARWLYDLPDWSTPMWRTVMQAGTRLTIVAVALVLLLAGRRRWAAVTGLAGAGAWALTDLLLKGWIDRPRPTVEALGRPIRDVVEHGGYPSTHAAVAAALATALLLGMPFAAGRARQPWVLTLVVVAATGTAVARVHVGAHWPLDAAGGAAVGTLCGVAAAALGGLTWGSERLTRRAEQPT